MKDYVWFYEETEANEFFLVCLERGIYCKKTYGSGMYGVEIDVEKTCCQKNTGYDIVQETLDRR